MSYPSFEAAQATVDEFLALLRWMNIDVASGSQSEADALSMLEVLELWRGLGTPPADSRELIRAAMGFVDLAGKVLSVAKKPGFSQLRPHLELISRTSMLQNRPSSVLDGDANKIAELYIACIALKDFENVAVDHPLRSKGDNPDVMFDFRGQRWAIAVKTAHSTTADQLLTNIAKGADQIEASEAKHGLVLIDLKNKLRHNELWPDSQVAHSETQVVQALYAQMQTIVDGLDIVPPEDWVMVLGDGRAAKPPVLFMGHSAFLGYPEHDQHAAYFMPAKMMLTYMVPYGDPVGAMKLANALSHEMQQFQ